MKVPRKNVLVVGNQAILASKARPLLERDEVLVINVKEDPGVFSLVNSTPFDLIILPYPSSSLDIADLVEEIRDWGSASRGCALLVVSDQGYLSEAQDLLKKGANRVVSLEWTAARFSAAVADLLAVEPRAALRAMVRVDVKVEGGTVPDVCVAVNVSESGMLLECPSPYRPGSEIKLTFSLPGDINPITLKAEVVRVTDPEKEGRTGFAVRFVSISEKDRKRIADYVRTSLEAVGPG